LTYGGNLGIGKTNPDNTLHVVGTSTVTGNSWIGGDLTVSGTVTVGNLQLPPILNNTNISTLSGVSTFNDVIVQNIAQFSSIGIGTTRPITNIDARTSTALLGSVGVGTTNPRVSLDIVGQGLFESIGITTNNTNGNGLVISDSAVILDNNLVEGNSVSVILDADSEIGIGTTSSRCAIDFSDAGENTLNGAYRYMLPPRITTSQRAGLSTVAGAIIYNTTTNRHQGYNGTSWNDLY
jgi:hypothetical protein